MNNQDKDTEDFQMRQLLPATAILIGVWLASAQAQAQCPPAIPSPADAFHVECFTLGRTVDQRCATAIDPTTCNTLNTSALSLGLLTQAGYNYLASIHFCAIHFNAGSGERIFDFCPEGCFATDTQILQSVGADGKANYVPAQSVKPDSPLMSMADESNLDDVSLTSHAVKRTVVGPEDADLFVFALSNGRTLRVTMHHPMVLDSGEIIEARKVEPGMSFVGHDGEIVAIKSITREKPEGDVFNFETGGDTQLSHIIVAEGVLVGDLKIQNDLGKEAAAIELRQ